jgi:hypothetical protein
VTRSATGQHVPLQNGRGTSAHASIAAQKLAWLKVLLADLTCSPTCPFQSARNKAALSPLWCTMAVETPAYGRKTPDGSLTMPSSLWSSTNRPLPQT